MEEIENESQSLARLAAAYGILPFYWDIQGVQHVSAKETKIKLLHALGVACDDERQIEESLEKLKISKWQKFCEPITAIRQSHLPIRFRYRYSINLGHRDCYWQIEFEKKGNAQGSFLLSNGRVIETSVCNGVEYVLSEILLPISPPLGYHKLKFEIKCENNVKTEFASESFLIIAPDSCYIHPLLDKGRRFWGLSAQLYSLASDSNWGIGDFGDLKRLAQYVASLGGSFIGLNPLHCTSPRGDAGISPYSPASRLAMNPMYLDIERCAQFLGSPIIKQFMEDENYKKAKAEVRSQDSVSYRKVAEIKFAALEELYTDFCANHLNSNTLLAKEFRSFVRKRGEELRKFAEYCAIQEHFQKKDSGVWGWPLWEEEYRDVENKAVRSFCKKNQIRVRFYLFLQWLIDKQLQEFKEFAKEQGLQIGLYLDLALGAAIAGSEAWANKDMYMFSASIGAPADKLAPQGQNWGLPALNPQKMREVGYKPIIEVLRSNMMYGGALRIDHVMSLQRLYLVPRGSKASDGAYLRYDLQELLAIIALESQRNKCMIIGEDLGTVPDEVRAGMYESKTLAYKVLYFMKNYTNGSFISTNLYPRCSLVVSATHDLATLRGFWEGNDLRLRKELKLHEDEVLSELKEERAGDRHALIQALKQNGLLTEVEAQKVLSEPNLFSFELLSAIHLFLAKSPCMLQAIQIEDLITQRDQANLPGTTIEHPNWKRRLSREIEDIFSDVHIRQLLLEVNKIRSEKIVLVQRELDN